MAWSFISVGTSSKAVKCRICGGEIPPDVSKARLAPDPHQDDRTFFYFHVGCLRPELAGATRLLATRA